MIFFIIYILLFVSSVFETIEKRKFTIFYFTFVLLFSVLLFFRYGQGVDYFNYLYAIITSNNAIEVYFRYHYFANRFEVSFSLLSYLIVHVFKLDPVWAISFISLFAFVPLTIFFFKYCSRPCACLFFYISIFFFIYPYSGIRQAACISLFACYLIPILYRKKYIKYFIGVLILSTFHNSSLLLLFLPLCLKIKFSKKNISLFLGISFILGLTIMPFVLRILFARLGDTGNVGDGYLSKHGFGLDYLSIILRLVLYYIISTLIFKRDLQKDNFLIFLFNIYTVSIITYLVFVSNSLLSSRLSIFFRIVEPVLLATLVLEGLYYKKLKLFYTCIFYFVGFIMYAKTITTELSLGNYSDNLEFYELPYVTIFNKKEIFFYRTPDRKLNRWIYY